MIVHLCILKLHFYVKLFVVLKCYLRVVVKYYIYTENEIYTLKVLLQILLRLSCF